MKIYIYKGGLSLVAKSGVGSAILERGGYRTDQYRIA